MNTDYKHSGIHRFSFSSYIHHLLFYGSLLTFFYLLSTTSSQAAGVGPNNSYYLVHNFQDDWQVFDRRYQNYVPYIRERHQSYSSFSLFLNLEDYRSYKLLYFAKNDNFLFINASLQKKLPNNTWVIMNLDSLHQIYQTNNLFLTFYGAISGVEDKTIFIGNQISNTQKPIQLTEAELSVKPRPQSSFGDFSVLVGIILLGSFVFLYNFHAKAFEHFYNVRDLLTIGKRIDTSLQNRLFDISNLFFVLNISLLIGYLYLFLVSKNVAIWGSRTLLEESETLGTWFWNYLRVSLFVLLLFFAKYLALFLLGTLYRLEKITNIHFFKIVQASGIFFLSLLIAVSILFYTSPSLSAAMANMVIITVVIFFIARLVLLYFTINKLASLKNLYLFSYLCIVELIPLIVGIRFAV